MILKRKKKSPSNRHRVENSPKQHSIKCQFDLKIYERFQFNTLIGTQDSLHSLHQFIYSLYNYVEKRKIILRHLFSIALIKALKIHCFKKDTFFSSTCYSRLNPLISCRIWNIDVCHCQWHDVLCFMYLPYQKGILTLILSTLVCEI